MRTLTWQTDFWAYIESMRTRPFAWGTHDCVTFARGAIEAISDRRIELAIDWHTAIEAEARLASLGGLQATTTRYLGAPMNWACLSCGDVVLADWSLGDGLCVHDGAQLLAPGPSGLRRVPWSTARLGWRID